MTENRQILKYTQDRKQTAGYKGTKFRAFTPEARSEASMVLKHKGAQKGLEQKICQDLRLPLDYIYSLALDVRQSLKKELNSFPTHCSVNIII